MAGFSVFISNGQEYISVSSEPLRQLIHYHMDEKYDQNLIGGRMLYDDDDSMKTKLLRDRSAVFTLISAVIEWSAWFEDHVIDDKASWSDVTIYGIENEDEVQRIAEEAITEFKTLQTCILETKARFNKEIINTFNNNLDLSYDMLHYALHMKIPTDMVCVNNQGVLVAGKILEVERTYGSMFSPPKLDITIMVYSHDGKCLAGHRAHTSVIEYVGIRPLSESNVFDLSDVDIQAKLIARGRKYVELTQSPAYVQYVGAISRRDWFATKKFRSDGRVMIDVRGMKVIDPDYDYYYAMGDRYSSAEHIGVTITDEVLMCTSPYVYGFSFTSKQWGEMTIDNISNITFREDAYDKLVMDDDIKQMLFSLVDSNQLIGKDFIDGKGGGCIFLLAGTPGVGKTLTAEAVAEKLNRPLYMVGVGELGTNVEDLETNLRNILDLASSWKAVLLLDEADIYMEKRDDFHIEKNAMTGVFLRMLEYYQGTLFLTTNRAKSIDQAFYSRISLAIRYPDLNQQSREHIWTKVLELYSIENIDVEHLAAYNLNGRQIKNVVRIATSLAASKGTQLQTIDMIKIINHVVAFNETIHPLSSAK